MTAIAYTAKRKLISGHTAGVTYSFDIGLQQLDSTEKQLRTRHKSIGGVSETWLQNIEDYYDLQTEPIEISHANLLNMREFLASVADGTPFTVDFDGTAEVPVNVVSVELESDTHKEMRLGVRYIQFAFKVRAL